MEEQDFSSGYTCLSVQPGREHRKEQDWRHGCLRIKIQEQRAGAEA